MIDNEETLKLSSSSSASSPNIGEDSKRSSGKRLPFWKILCFVFLDLTCCAAYGFVSSVLRPKQIIEIIGDEQKSIVLGITVTLCAITAIITGPITGVISDKFKHYRFPIIIFGVVTHSVTLLMRSLTTTVRDLIAGPQGASDVLNIITLIVYIVLNLIGEITFTISWSPYIALLPDKIPKEQFGITSGLFTITTMIGSMLGVGVFGYFYTDLHAFWTSLAVVILVFLSVVALIPFFRGESVHKYDDYNVERNEDESIIHPRQKESVGTAMKTLFRSFKNKNFLLVVLATFSSNIGVALVSTYFLYFIIDLIHPHYTIIVWTGYIHTAEQAQAVTITIMFFCGIVSSLITGVMIDRLHNNLKVIKWLVFLSALMSVIGTVLLIAIVTFNIVILASLFYGVATGCMYCCTIVLVNHLLPSKEDFAKDLSIWYISKMLPIVIASPFGAVFIQLGSALHSKFQFPRGLGYFMIFGVTSLVQIVAFLLILVIRHRKKRRSSNTGHQDETEVTTY